MNLWIRTVQVNTGLLVQQPGGIRGQHRKLRQPLLPQGIGGIMACGRMAHQQITAGGMAQPRIQVTQIGGLPPLKIVHPQKARVHGIAAGLRQSAELATTQRLHHFCF